MALTSMGKHIDVVFSRAVSKVLLDFKKKKERNYQNAFQAIMGGGGYPILGPYGRGYHIQDQNGGVPPSKTEWGTHPSVQTWGGGWGYPRPRLDGVPPPPNQQSEHLLRCGAVCLLRSRRRTFLFLRNFCALTNPWYQKITSTIHFYLTSDGSVILSGRGGMSPIPKVGASDY